MLDHQNDVHSVVLIYGQAMPTQTAESMGRFLNPFTAFRQSQFPTNGPVLYVCGDAHVWSYDPEYR